MHERAIFPAWSLEAEETLRTLETSRTGLTEEDVRLRQKHFGLNTLPQKRHFTVLNLITKQFTSPLIFILIGAAALTMYLHEWVDATVITLAILINAGLGFYQEFRAENALEKLTTYVRERARVIRDGTEEEIDSIQLVPGDIIRVAYGQRIPADARVIEAHEITLDEAVLTGESMPVFKENTTLSEGTDVPDRTNMLHAGTLVTEGAALAVVTAIDSSTEIGRIAELVSTTKDAKTPLQTALAHMAWMMFVLIAVLTVAIFFLGLARGESVFDMLLMASAISVGAVPEALPIALTVILAVGVERLAQRKGVMRNLAATETLGSASIVMTDKTGTLTEADMRLVEIITHRELVGATRMGGFEEDEKEILESALWGTDVTIENPHAPKKKWKFLGRPFEASVVRAAHERGIDVTHFLAERKPPLLVFNSTNKFSIVVGTDAQYVIGAPDILLKRSTLSKDEYVTAEEKIHAVSAEGKRLLGVARLTGHARKSASPDDAEHLEFLGILVFKDPIRADAPAAVEKIERLGARMVMLTGDMKGTALSVAREIGWKVDEGAVITGEEFRSLPDAELRAAVPHLKIFARVTPEDKLRIGRLYQERGEIVAMTGDGVNDAPSLKAVDIGVALGSGSDVAKATADLILLDDNFKTIVAAIEEGRRILENIRKVFVYLVSTCLAEIFLVGGALLLGLPLPLTALQIIWVNFFSDSLPALSFAFEKHYALEREKRGVHAIFSREVKILTASIGGVSSVLLFGFYWYLLESGVDVAHAQSALFLSFSLYVLLVAFSLRHLRRPFYFYSPFSNPYLSLSIGFGVLLTIATVTVPFLENIFSLVTPPAALWTLVGFWLLVNLFLVECAKWVALRMGASGQ